MYDNTYHCLASITRQLKCSSPTACLRQERASGTKAAAKLRGPKKLTIYEAEDKAKKSIASLKTYTGGVGLKCLKILLVYVSNALKDDPK